jgi:hypothetical protein
LLIKKKLTVNVGSLSGTEGEASLMSSAWTLPVSMAADMAAATALSFMMKEVTEELEQRIKDVTRGCARGGAGTQ